MEQQRTVSDPIDAEEPLWVIKQQKSFTIFINQFFKNPADQIQDLSVDFRDGRKLLKLLSIVLDTEVPSPEKGKMRLHHVNNVNKAIQLMTANRVKLVNVGPEEIVDGNLKMTLGMTWAIILRNFIESIKEGGATAKEGLLLWCQNKTAGYKNVKIKDFSRSWKNGLGFCALIHTHRPDLIDYDSLVQKDDPALALETAFEVAKQNFDIPRILEVEDIMQSETLDDKSIMAYVALYYHHFSKFNSVEQAAKRLQKILEMNEDNDNFINNYENSSSNLYRWMKEKKPFLTDRCGECPSPDDIREKYDQFRQYRQSEKPPRADEKSRLDSDYQSIQTRLNLQKRPQYIPPNELNPKFLDDMWKDLEGEEQSLLEWLDRMQKLMEKIEYLMTRFYYKCTMQEQWMTSVSGSFNLDTITLETGLSELIGLAKKQKTSDSEMISRQARIQQITQLKDQLAALAYHKMGDIEARYSSLMCQWTELQASVTQYTTQLEAVTAQAQKLDEIRVEYAQAAEGIRIWLDDSLEDYGEDYKPRTTIEIEEWKKDHSMFMDNLPKKVSEMNRLQQLYQEQTSFTTEPNPYSSVTLDLLQQRSTDLHQLCGERNTMLHTESEKLSISESMRQELDQKIKELDSWRKSCADRVSAVVMERSGTLEDRKNKLRSLCSELESYSDSQLTHLDAISEKIKEIQALHWETALDASASMRSSYNILNRGINSAISEIDNQIAIRDSSGLTEKETDDIKKAFNLCAKGEDKSILSHQEFLNCLISLSFDLSVESLEDPKFLKIIAIVDPVNSGSIKLSALLTYVTSQRKDADNADDIAESFKVMASGKDYIMPEEILKSLSQKHAQDCISRMVPSTHPDAPPGALDYFSFAENIYGESEV